MPIKTILHICRLTLAVLWLYQGIVPKIMGPHPDEIIIADGVLSLQAFSLPVLKSLSAQQMVFYAGMGEVVFGLLIFLFYKQRLIYTFNNMALVILFIMTVWLTPQFIMAAFNAFAINVAMFAIGCIAIVCLKSADDKWSFIIK